MDKKVFDELMKRGIVTVVGLNPEDYKDIADLQIKQLATSIGAAKIYDDLTIDEEELEEIKAAFINAIDAGGDVTLEADLTIDSTIKVTKDVTINLNGHTLTSNIWDEDGENNSYVFQVTGGKLTLEGEGTIEASEAIYSMAVWANGGDVVINGGTYKNHGDSCDLVYASKKGNIVINGGEFVACGPATGTAPGTKNPYSALNVKDADYKSKKCSISVKGGKFYMFDPANNLSEGPNTNFVVEGYESVQNGDWFVVSTKPAEETPKVEKTQIIEIGE